MIIFHRRYFGGRFISECYKIIELKLTVLTENRAGIKFLAEHGLSYYIEIGDEKILFDTGQSDVFLKNAEKLGIDIRNSVDKIILSHGHWDHGDGLQFITNKTLITHPKSFIKRYGKTDQTKIGLKLSIDEIRIKFNVTESEKPFNVTDNVFFLGEIPRINNFESKTTSFIDGNGNEDYVPDDSALAVVENSELIIVTGCSHSGICNICEYAKMVTGIPIISTVIGGFHLKHRNLQTEKTIEYFRKNKIKRVLPSHCTVLPALTAFYNNFRCEPVKTGMVFEF